MTEPRIGRFLVASLHQAIAELLPDRLEFYENWLTHHGLREGTIGLAPLHAGTELPARRRGGVRPGDGARRRLRRAVDGQWPAGPRAPRPAHAAAAPEDARGAADRARSRQRNVPRLAGDHAYAQGGRFDRSARLVVLPGARSIGAAALRVLRRRDLPYLQLFAVPGEAQMDACRAAGGGQVCSMSVIIRQATAGESAAA